MEDVLEYHNLPYDPSRSVVCMDETNRQLLGEVTPPILMTAGHPQIHDYEYVRNGVVEIFMVFVPEFGVCATFSFRVLLFRCMVINLTPSILMRPRFSIAANCRRTRGIQLASRHPRDRSP